jgi:hypothetical protein
MLFNAFSQEKSIATPDDGTICPNIYESVNCVFCDMNCRDDGYGDGVR